MLDARKGMVYAGLYSFEGNRIKTVMKESELSPAGLVREIEGRDIDPRDIVFLGGGLKPHGEAVKGAFQDARIAAESLWHIRASNIAQIAHDRHTSGEKGAAPHEITPLYLRKSEAEIKSRNL
ncbi:MAG: hypothetical protein HZB83_00535 [Deltaproteobacteria bacterium]|nr:hypothetical protein [Deltaproteobacteria bacterium]